MAEYSPINYNIDVKSPFERSIQGYQAGAAIRDDQLKQQQLAQQQAAQIQMQQDLSGLSQKMQSGTANAQDIASIGTKYPQLTKQLKDSWDVLNTDQQQVKLNQATQIYSALNSGNKDVALDMLDKQAEAAKNSGNQRDYAGSKALADLIRLHPESAQTTAGLYLSSVLGPEKFATTFSTLGDQGRKQGLFPSELSKSESEAGIKGAEAANTPTKLSLDNSNTQSQINERVNRLALDRDKLTTETQTKLLELNQKFGELPEFVAKDINSAATDSIASQQSADKMNDLANKIENAGLNSGVNAKVGEIWKNTFGSQNELTRIRSEYNRIVTPAAMSAYKKVASGSTSDKDIDTAMTGVPKDTADPAMMASFLRGAAKLQQYDSILNNAKSEWLGAVKNLNKAKTDIEIDGVKVPSGTTFKEFTDKYLDQKLQQKNAQQSLGAVQGRAYMRFANPGAQ